MKISIITPSFQQAAFLEKTILSVLSQQVSDLEYMVIDGGSTDGSVDIIRQYAPRLTWWASEPDNGQADAINKGLARASGDIVAWLNSDDYYLPDTLKQVLKIFDQNPDVGLVYGDVLAVDENDQAINLMRYQNWGLQGLMRFEIIGQPSVFFRRSALLQSGYLDLQYRYLLDHQFWLKLASRTNIMYVRETFSAARYHPEAKNVAQAALFGAEAFKIVDWMKQDPLLSSLYQRDQKKVNAGAQRLNAFYLAEGQRWGQAFKAYLKCFWNAPGYLKRDWRRFGYTLLNLMGLKSLVSVANQQRNKKRQTNLNSARKR